MTKMFCNCSIVNTHACTGYITRMDTIQCNTDKDSHETLLDQSVAPLV